MLRLAHWPQWVVAGQLNWQLATGASASDIASVASEDYAPLLTIDVALPAT